MRTALGIKANSFLARRVRDQGWFCLASRPLWSAPTCRSFIFLRPSIFRVSVGCRVGVIVKESGDESPHSKIYVSRITGFESPRQKITAPKHERGRFAFPVGAAKRGMNSATSRQRQVAQSGSRQDSKTGKSARPTWRTPPDYVPGIQLVPASGTFAIAAASTVSATKSSGSRWCTFDLPQARANVVTSMSKTCR